MPKRVSASVVSASAWRTAASLASSMPASIIAISISHSCVPIRYDASAKGPVPGERTATSSPTAFFARRIASNITGMRPSVYGSGASRSNTSLMFDSGGFCRDGSSPSSRDVTQPKPSAM